MIDNILDNYKKVTEDIIKNIKSDLEVDKLMDKREELIKELFKNENLSSNDIKIAYISKGLLELDQNLKLVIEEQQHKVKEEIKSLHKIKNANNVYEKNRKINSFFSVKI